MSCGVELKTNIYMLNIPAIGTGSVNFYGQKYFLEWERPEKLKGGWIFITVVFNSLRYINNQ